MQFKPRKLSPTKLFRFIKKLLHMCLTKGEYKRSLVPVVP